MSHNQSPQFRRFVSSVLLFSSFLTPFAQTVRPVAAQPAGRAATGRTIRITGIAVDDPIVALTASAASPLSANESGAFTASVQSGTNVAYAWDFGDGALGNGPTPVHAYAMPGNYTAVVTASNNANMLTDTVPVLVAACWTTRDDGATVFASADAQALRDAVAAASAGDTVKVAGTCAGVTAGYVVDVDKALTLRGGYAPTDWQSSNPALQPTLLDAQTAGRVVHVSAGNVTLDALTVANGRTPASFSEYGAGIRVSAGAAFSLTNSSVVSNAALGQSSSGGGLAILTGTVQISGTRFVSNSVALYGSGGALHVAGSAGQFRVHDSVFVDNHGHQGGAISLQTNSGGHLVNSLVQSNTAVTVGGGIFAIHLYLSDTRLIGNVSQSSGGGIYALRAITVERTLVEGNTARYIGGGVRLQDGIAEIANSRFVSNTAVLGHGGAAYISGFHASTSRVSNSHFAGNTAGDEGGALFAAAGSGTTTATVSSSTFISNSAAEGGGAIYAGNGMTVRMDNSLLARNNAASGPADIGLGGSSQPAGLHARHNTFIAATAGEGIAVEIGHDVNNEVGTLVNSIFDGYAIGLALGPRPASLSADGVLWSNVLTPTSAASITVTHAYTGAASFVDRSGGNYHLTPVSAAVDRAVGTTLINDIDGDARPLGNAADLGYDELSTLPPLNLSVSNNSTTTLGAVTEFSASVTAVSGVTYAWAFGDGATGTGATPAHAYAAVGVYTATVTATNAYGAASAETVVTIVRAPNTAPTITPLTPLSNVSIVIGSGPYSATVVVGDNETSSSALTVTARANNGDLLPAGALTLSGSGAQRTLTIAPAAGITGTGTITITVYDADGVSARYSFPFSVSERAMLRRWLFPMALN